MKNVKFSSIGLMDILYFTTRPKNREKMIQSASTKPLVAEYETNRKAEERHPESKNSSSATSLNTTQTSNPTSSKRKTAPILRFSERDNTSSYAK